MQTISQVDRCPSSRAILVLAVLAIVVGVSTGCRISTIDGARRAAKIASLGSFNGIRVEEVERNPEIGFLKRLVTRPPQPTERTAQLLRRYNLADRYAEEPEYVIRWMTASCDGSPSMDEVHALAEIALIQANWAAQKLDKETATEFYATAIVHSYQFLFDSKLDVQRNAYDPHFRSICDIYNQSLEGLLRIACDSGKLQFGMRHLVGEGDLAFEFTVEIQGRWKDEVFERFELTNDYEMHGIDNLYHTYGLGVPLIAVHDSSETNDPSARYYPPSLTLPLTAFCEVEFDRDGDHESGVHVRRAILKLYDPLETTNFQLANRTVPLESDITTPLAFHLNDPLLSTGVLATASMINANIAKDLYGLYMLEPFDPNKIPVVMVHGLWSSPTTWLEMFNDLRANRDLRSNYQFWFYSYPTGQPFWNSAREMRGHLAEARRALDPQGTSSALDRMVLVGHSMGGLVSRLQTLESDSSFWNLISHTEFRRLQGDPDSLDMLEDTFFFRPNPSVKRVITLGTPHRGSSLANTATKWASQKLFTLPDTLTQDFRSIARQNKELIENEQLLTMTTSIDSLAPDSPFFDVMEAARRSEDVAYHNVMGNLLRNNLLIKTAGTMKNGDGVVSIQSARANDVESEIEIPAEHAKIHQHPRAILEVRRILLDHLVDCQRISKEQMPVMHAGFEKSYPDKNFVRQAVLDQDK